MEIKPTIQFDDFAKIDLRVGTIVQAEPHPNADRLLKLQVDMGSEQRQICAGIKAHYAPEDLVGRQIVVVANLAPRQLRGEESQGMLLAASDDGETPSVVLISPSAEIAPGSSVG